MDGNHHLNKNWKNTDPNDICILGTRGYFPDKPAYFQVLQEKQKMPEDVCN